MKYFATRLIPFFVVYVFLAIHAEVCLAQAPGVGLARIKTDVTNDWRRSGSTGDLTVEPDGQWSSQYEWINGAKTLTGRQPVKVRQSTHKPGVTAITMGSGNYHLLGGSWHYKGFGIGDSYLEGMPNPSKMVSVPSMSSLLRPVGRWQTMIKLNQVVVPDDTQFVWHNFKSVTTDVILAYTYIEGTALVQVMDRTKVRWSRPDESVEQLTPQLPADYLDNPTKELKRVEPAKDIEKALTIWEAPIAEKNLKNLKTFPKFNSAEECARFLYEKVLQTESDEEAYYWLFSLLDTNFFIPHKPLLGDEGDGKLKNVIERRAKIKSSYPASSPDPRKSKHADPRKHYFYFPRTDGKANAQLFIFGQNGTFTLMDIQFPTD